MDFNSNIEDINKVLNGKLDQIEENIIISIFAIVIILGIFGNLLVIWTILFNKPMRTSNNLIIFNLAISDLILCFFSIPFNVYKTLRHTWIFGDFLCRLTPFFQATNVFVSSMSITAIALDRYIHIVCAVRLRQSSSKSILRTYYSMTICVLIWLFAFMLSSPLFIYNTTTHISLSLNENSFNTQLLDTLSNEMIDMTSESLIPFTSLSKDNTSLYSTTSSPTNFSSFLIDDNDVYSIYHCVENWTNHKTRMIYSYSSLMIQYVMPILIVGIAYCSIWWKLKTHRSKLKKHTNKFTDTQFKINKDLKTNLLTINELNTHTSMVSKKRTSLNNEHKKRRRKMNILLMSISLIFAASWLPLNIFNILSDLKLKILKADHMYFLINAICILLGMSSAVSNPFVYGVLNENFRREYSRIFNVLFKRVCFSKQSDALEPTVNRKIQYSVKSIKSQQNQQQKGEQMSIKFNNQSNQSNVNSNIKENDFKDLIVNEMQ